jgi:hypothetical protein
VGSKRTSSGGNGGHHVWWGGLFFRLLATAASVGVFACAAGGKICANPPYIQRKCAIWADRVSFNVCRGNASTRHAPHCLPNSQQHPTAAASRYVRPPPPRGASAGAASPSSQADTAQRERCHVERMLDLGGERKSPRQASLLVRTTLSTPIAKDISRHRGRVSQLGLSSSQLKL